MAYVFTHATVLDGTADMEPRPNTTIVVNDEGRIAAIGAAEEIVPPVNAQEIDLKGAYLAPGLVNLHVHFCGSASRRAQVLRATLSTRWWETRSACGACAASSKSTRSSSSRAA